MSPFHRTIVLCSALSLSAITVATPLPDTEQPEPQAESQPQEPTCYTFKEKGWQFYSNKRRPKLPIVGDQSEMLLIPDNQFQTGVVAAINSSVKPPFEATFDYSTWDDDGSEWATWNSADGFTFFFLKDTSDYGTPPDGNSLGLKQEGGGYAVRFKLYGHRSIWLTGIENTLLDWQPFSKAYSQRQWVPVNVTVMNDSIRVQANNQVVLNHEADVATAFSDLGFTAATGAADVEIAVRHLCIKPLSQESIDLNPIEPATYPPTGEDNFVPAPGLEGLDTFPANTGPANTDQN